MSNLKAMAAVSLVVTLTACSENIRPPEAGIGGGVQPRYEQPAPNDNGAITGDQPGNESPPLLQGSNSSDVLITEEIRQSLVADDSLFLGSWNIRIVTDDGAVALRGSAMTEAVKNRIGRVAERAPNVTKVFNLLEVRGADPI